MKDDTITCEAVLAQLHELASPHPTAIDDKSLRDHIEGCDSCRNELEQLSRLLSAIGLQEQLRNISSTTEDVEAEIEFHSKRAAERFHARRLSLVNQAVEFLVGLSPNARIHSLKRAAASILAERASDEVTLFDLVWDARGPRVGATPPWIGVGIGSQAGLAQRGEDAPSPADSLTEQVTDAATWLNAIAGGSNSQASSVEPPVELAVSALEQVAASVLLDAEPHEDFTNE